MRSSISIFGVEQTRSHDFVTEKSTGQSTVLIQYNKNGHKQKEGTPFKAFKKSHILCEPETT